MGWRHKNLKPIPWNCNIGTLTRLQQKFQEFKGFLEYKHRAKHKWVGERYYDRFVGLWWVRVWVDWVSVEWNTCLSHPTTFLSPWDTSDVSMLAEPLSTRSPHRDRRAAWDAKPAIRSVLHLCFSLWFFFSVPMRSWMKVMRKWERFFFSNEKLRVGVGFAPRVPPGTRSRSKL